MSSVQQSNSVLYIYSIYIYTLLIFFSIIVYHKILNIVPCVNGISLVIQQERIRLPVQKIRVQSLIQKDPLEKEMATCPRILTRRTEEPGGL